MTPALRTLLHQLGSACLISADGVEDEGDRVYLGSTNHADTLRKARDLYFDWCVENDDMGEDVETP